MKDKVYTWAIGIGFIFLFLICEVMFLVECYGNSGEWWKLIPLGILLCGLGIGIIVFGIKLEEFENENK